MVSDKENLDNPISFADFFHNNFGCFGCFLVLNDSTTLAAQTVTLSSEGPLNEMYPDSMGEYQLAEEENWYRHKDREDRFLMFNKLGIPMFRQLIFYILL